MKRIRLKIPELLNIFAFLLYLFGSSLAHIEDGSELSLWLAAFATGMAFCVTVLPVLGIGWLRMDSKGCRAGYWLALLLQIASWGTFGLAGYFRLRAQLSRFHTLLTLTTLLWAGWMLILVYSRHACQGLTAHDTLKEEIPEITIQPRPPEEEKR
jgi:Na+/proline symporter